jgi:hypothetical protein
MYKLVYRENVFLEEDLTLRESYLPHSLSMYMYFYVVGIFASRGGKSASID